MSVKGNVERLQLGRNSWQECESTLRCPQKRKRCVVMNVGVFSVWGCRRRRPKESETCVCASHESFLTVLKINWKRQPIPPERFSLFSFYLICLLWRSGEREPPTTSVAPQSDSREETMRGVGIFLHFTGLIKDFLWPKTEFWIIYFIDVLSVVFINLSKEAKRLLARNASRGHIYYIYVSDRVFKTRTRGFS